jgi:hydroxyacylglutathione hydrolase
MYFRQLLNEETACASYLLGCKSESTLAVVDPHIDLVDEYIALAEEQSATIAAVFETHLQADHVSGLPALVEKAGATPYLPAGSGAEFPHLALDDGREVVLGNTAIRALATPGHATAHHAYVVCDHVRAPEPWLVLTGDALLVGDAGRPDLHADGGASVMAMARTLHRSLVDRLLRLPDHVLVYPAHYAGSVCGRGLSAHPASTIGFERRHNPLLGLSSADAFAEKVVTDIPPPPENQREIMTANRLGCAYVPG